MKFIRIMMVAALFIVLALAGCGNEKNGSMTVTVGPTTANGITTITVTVRYTNPTNSNLLGVPYTVKSFYNGVLLESFEDSFNNSGTTIYTYAFAQTVVPAGTTGAPDIFSIEASTGGLTGSAFAAIPTVAAPSPPAPAALTLTPASVSLVGYSIGQSATVAITGGTAPYAQILSPNNNPDVSVSLTGNTLLITKTSAVTPSTIASVLVTDSTPTTPSQATLTITY